MKIYLTKYYTMCLYTADILEPCDHSECRISVFIKNLYPHIPNPEVPQQLSSPQIEVEGEVSGVDEEQVWRELGELRKQIEEIELMLTKILGMLRSLGIEV